MVEVPFAFLDYVMPELLILVPVCYLIGVVFKNSKAMRDESIPLVLGIFSIMMSLLYIFSVNDVTSFKDVATLIFAGVTQGILCAGGSVYINQLKVQARKINKDNKIK